MCCSLSPVPVLLDLLSLVCFSTVDYMVDPPPAVPSTVHSVELLGKCKNKYQAKYTALQNTAIRVIQKLSHNATKPNIATTSF